MYYIVCYDITENCIRKRVATYLESFAYRLQYSVFGCERNAREYERMCGELLRLTAQSEKRSLLVAPLCGACESRIWQVGEPLEEEQLCIVA